MGWLVTLFFAVFFIAVALAGVKIVPQSREYVVERFGRYFKTLHAGLNFIVPFLDRVAFKVVILERNLPEFAIRVITSDNVEVILNTTVFFRVTDAAKSKYRIEDLDAALSTSTESIVRSSCGKLDLDAIQTSRESLNTEIASNLSRAADIWGVEVTRTEITDVELDEQTRTAQRLQLNADRERRAVIAKAEGDKRMIELQAEAELYKAQKEAEAIRVKADADAYAVEKNAGAEAKQTELLADAIGRTNGELAVDFEVRKIQAEAITSLGTSDNTKTLILPTNVTSALGAVEVLADTIKDKG
jgi:regulator of protease activity HflC (stomatin/prohibitin superfamily)